MRTLASVWFVLFLMFSLVQAGDDDTHRKELEALRGNWNVIDGQKDLQNQWSMVEFKVKKGSSQTHVVMKREKNKPKADKEQARSDFVIRRGTWLADQEQAKKSDLVALRGTWIAEHEQYVPAGAGLEYRMVFSDDGKVTLRRAGSSSKATFKLDPAAKPKRIDLVLDEETFFGIYSLDGDLLKLCLPGLGNNRRPTELADKEGRVHLLTLKREKAPVPGKDGGKR